MINKDLLDILRCPLDPRQRLELGADHLVCTRCALRYPIRDGFPVLVVEEAMLPAGCASISQLPCQKEAKPPPKG